MRLQLYQLSVNYGLYLSQVMVVCTFPPCAADTHQRRLFGKSNEISE
jgi:hypothetical protein